MNKRNRSIIKAALAAVLLLSACGNTDNIRSENTQINVTRSEISAGTDSAGTNEDTCSENSLTDSVTGINESGSETIYSEEEVKELKISVNGTEYTAHFYDTTAAEEFKAMLPLTLNMSELNGNEKYIYLDSDLTAASEKVGSIKKGELMLYGSNCIVLFYDSFVTPYSYTRLGYIDDPAGIEKAVGPGSITVDLYTE